MMQLYRNIIDVQNIILSSSGLNENMVRLAGRCEQKTRPSQLLLHHFSKSNWKHGG